MMTKNTQPIHVASAIEAQMALTAARHALASASTTILRQAMSLETRVIATGLAEYAAEIERAERRLVQVVQWVSDTPLAELARIEDAAAGEVASAPVPVADMIRQDQHEKRVEAARAATTGKGNAKRKS